MKIVSQRVVGFQSFKDSGDVCYQHGTNIIVGQNNSGKSSLISSMKDPLRDDRHRDQFLYKQYLLPLPFVEIVVSLTGDELKQALFRNGQSFEFPIPVGNKIQNMFQLEPFLQKLFDKEEVVFRLRRRPGLPFLSEYPSHRLFPSTDGDGKLAVTLSPVNGELRWDGTSYGGDSFPTLIDWLWQQDTFFFDAERYRTGRSAQIHATRLNSDASNLPAVLSTLAGERGSLFQKLVEHMREIFPTFGNLSVRPCPDGSTDVEVLIWPTSDMITPELGFPLETSGTGISQTLAILTAVMTLNRCVIVIDEINSFLHPAATKSLMRIIGEYYSDHQFIISTHAPEVISFSNNKAFFVVKKLGYNSEVKTVDLRERSNFRDVAEMLGISMTDVFAADKIIWVEGPTEELCFPLLYKSKGKSMPEGLVMTSVTTGDFSAKKRNRALVYEIYTKLSQASATLTTTVAFSFDGENLSEQEKKQMVKESNGLLSFIPRRHLECYLIDPEAIATFINSQESVEVDNHTPEEVRACLISLASGSDFSLVSWTGDLESVNWLKEVDAANIINACCTEMSSARVVFRKKADSLF